MSKNRINKFFLIFSLFLVMSSSVFCEDNTPKPYSNDEFPQALKDLRRFEVLTLGAMPFVILDTTMVYSGYKSIAYGDDFNPLAASDYTQEEQRNIILTSLGISVGIGLFDYVFHLIKRNIDTTKQRKTLNSEINVTPIQEDPDAKKIELQPPSEMQNIPDANSDTAEEDVLVLEE